MTGVQTCALPIWFDVLFHLGDIFDSRRGQTVGNLNNFLYILDYALEVGVKIVIIPGNHDKVFYGEEDSFLNPFTHHPAYTLIKSYYQLQLTENIVVHFLPYFLDQVYNQYLQNVIFSDKQDILFTHIGITGARMNNGVEVEGIKQSSFQGFEKVYIGHYHDKQIFGKFNYIGSSIQHNFGETPEKGLTLLYDDLSFSTHELDFPHYIKIDIDVDRIGVNEIRELQEESQSSNDFLKVVLCGSEEKVKSFDKTQLLSSGITVQLKVDNILKKEVDERVEPFTSISLLSEFSKFCKKNELQEENGIVYLNKILK